MNKYLSLLQSPLPRIRSLHEFSPEHLNLDQMKQIPEKLKQVLLDRKLSIEQVVSPKKIDNQLVSLRGIPNIVDKLKHFHTSLNDPLRLRCLESVNEMEVIFESNTDAYLNFNSHKVEDVVFDAKDSKETKIAKQKLCRQMFHSKKFAMQSVFNNLQNLGASYQRGLNCLDKLDNMILSLEPLRGMIQKQSKNVLESASTLVDDHIINGCNELYGKLVSGNMFLLAQSREDSLTTEQFDRIRGYSHDLILNIITQKKSAAYMYKHLMDIQSATTRLKALQANSELSKIIIYNFARVHGALRQFNALVGKAYLALSKIDEIVDCYRTVESLETLAAQENSDHVNQSIPPTERVVLAKVIGEVEKEKSLLTREQYEYIIQNQVNSRKTISEISDRLRDKLNHTIRNHVYGNDDIKELEELYNSFSDTLNHLVTELSLGSEKLNAQQGTFLGSLRSLIREVVHDLKPKLEREYLQNGENVVEVDKHPNVARLEMRLRKLIRQTKLAMQDIYKMEEARSKISSTSEMAKRDAKPLNQIDSSSLAKHLRLNQVSKLIGDCFVTLNKEKMLTNIGPIVSCLTPILDIYTQDVSSYLNIILASLNLKLTSTNQLIGFFIQLVQGGFGEPKKIVDEDGAEGAQSGKLTEDNTGFGEGEGQTDASNKLEFESQLDDLKKDSSKEEEKKEGEEKSIEAHDDGVEMSDDFDAKANGADENQGEDMPELDDEEDQDELKDLDKELDTVDKDDDKLDEKLWNEKDDEESLKDNEDEQDLREAEAECSGQPEKEESGLQAKDERLKDSEMKEESKENEETSKDDKNDDDIEVDTDDMSKDDQINQIPPIDQEDYEVDFDVDDEAELAKKEAEMESSEKDDDGKQNEANDNLIDMSVSDDDDDKINEKDDAKEVGEEPANSNDTEVKSDGELTQDDEDDSKSGEPDSQNTIDNDEIDNKLEVALRNHPLIEEKLEDNIDEQIKSLTSQYQQAVEDSTREMKGNKYGQHNLYEIFPEDPNEPLDFDQENEKCDDQEGEENESKLGEQQKAQKGANGEGDQEKVPMEIQNGDIDPKNEEEEKSKQERDKSTKRSVAERDEEKEGKEIKRQKILDAAKDKSKSREEKEEKSEVTSDTRHVDANTSSNLEVIDLCSSSDDEYMDPLQELPETGESNETRLRMDKRKDKPEKSQSKKPDKETKETEKSEKNPIDNEDAVKAMETLSSISSIESGELASGSDDEDESEENFEPEEGGRDLNTSYNTNLGLLKFISLQVQERLNDDEKKDDNLMQRIDIELNKKPSEEHESVDTDRLKGLWIDCTKRNKHLVQELCQQLQIVLQPTKMSKYKGDYKSGKRLNMRKIISYIASHYRKDKIWLRRTKPSKRTYNITLAVDNSSSMSENNCRQMTYQSLALLATSLSLIEAGSLSVVSFGEKVKCVHEFGQPYSDAIGAQWLRELRFNETRTSYSQLLDFSIRSFAKQARVTQTQQQQHQANLSQLLVLISDGRNISSEEEEVKCALRQLKSMGVLTLFVIIDDLARNEGKSIVDVKRCFLNFGNQMQMLNYMDTFPFPFYVLLRKLETMPSVLGEALRQWFELVSASG